MKRRDFIAKSGVLSAGAYMAGSGLLASCAGQSKNRELAKHVIDKVEYGSVNYHWPRHVGKNARIGIHGQHKKANYIKLYTDQGATGWAYGRYVEADKASLMESILGKNLDQLIVPSEGIVTEVHKAFDLPLHDLAGVILDQPVYKMLGAAGPMEKEVYSGMIYFDELEPEENPTGIEKVMENCRWDYEYGYRQLKVKIGRSGRWYPHDEGLAMDIRIVKMIYEEFGDEVGILVDANDMYSLQDAIDFLKGVEGIPIYWFEEPFVENLEDGRKLKDWMMANGFEDTYYADGERNPDFDVCMQLAREDKLDVYLPDIAGYGFTPWRKMMPSLKEMNILSSPHAWGSMLKTNYTAHISAGLGNVCTIEGVTCLSDEIDFGDYKIIDGKLRVSEDPGFGMKLL
ncbi:MAG TPA: mandelate racemase/muconate lactonizing protein [Bacteroides sp.]|nr:mandelate racemase/muconate lactonizing protein [Bacteroides sp.]